MFALVYCLQPSRLPDCNSYHTKAIIYLSARKKNAIKKCNNLGQAIYYILYKIHVFFFNEETKKFFIVIFKTVHSNGNSLFFNILFAL